MSEDGLSGLGFAISAELPPAASDMSLTLDQRRARAQAQPKDELGRFSSHDPWIRVRQSDWKRVIATIAERDAKLEEWTRLHEQQIETELGLASELTMAREMVANRGAKIAELEQMADVCAQTEMAYMEMAGTIRDQQAELTCLRAKLARPDLIPMPGLKLGIFIGGFVTTLVATGLAYFTHLI